MLSPAEIDVLIVIDCPLISYAIEVTDVAEVNDIIDVIRASAVPHRAIAKVFTA